MRPPTNQSIRRHLSDCSLTSVCPARPPRRLSPSLSLPSPPPPLFTTETPLAYRKRTDPGHPRARDRVSDERIGELGWRLMWTDCGIGLERFASVWSCKYKYYYIYTPKLHISNWSEKKVNKCIWEHFYQIPVLIICVFEILDRRRKIKRDAGNWLARIVLMLFIHMCDTFSNAMRIEEVSMYLIQDRGII